MSIAQRGLASKLLVTSILLELVGCGARVEVDVATDTNSETGVSTGTGVGTGVNTGVYSGTSVGSGVNTGVNFGTGGATHTTIATGGATHTTIATGGAKAINTGVVTSTSTGSGTGLILGCNGLTVPPASGTLNVSGGYVTTGSLKGYGFTWVGSLSNTFTCITPTCNATGCTPLFGSSALCAAGVVGADTSYNSVVGVGFNLNQDVSGNVNGTVAAPAVVTIVSTAYGAGAGNASIRLQISDAGASTTWCLDAGKWASGMPIPITAFNTACWDDSGTFLSTGTQIQAIHLVVPSDGTQARPFAFCLAGVTFT